MSLEIPSYSEYIQALYIHMHVTHEVKHLNAYRFKYITYGNVYLINKYTFDVN